MTPKRVVTGLAATTAALLILIWSGDPVVPGHGFMTRAEAIIGRPLTPLSYAGVARRTTYRAFAYGAPGLAGAAAGGAYAYPAAGCVQVVGVYGQVITRCR
ncbi:hypothetical protein [Microvirga massiliensis]|uniref:hypothetical protein n=1 Tax=Microvirga massiliensis TaxID=1033741 RepID=UPI00069BE35B|nr:hypothetical protein [Microvirga massiliensis]